MGCCSDTEVRKVVHRVHGGSRHGFRMHGGLFRGGTNVMVFCHPCDCHGHEHSPEDEIKELEEMQRDLEQEVADIAERIKELREEMNGEDDATDD